MDASPSKSFFEIKKKIETQINTFLWKKTYGEDVEIFMSVIRVHLNNFRNPARQFNRKEKALVVSIEIEPEEFIDADDIFFKKMICDSILKSVLLINEVKMCPKTFNLNAFYNDLSIFIKEL